MYYTQYSARVDKNYPKVLKKLSTTYQQLWIKKWAYKFVHSKIFLLYQEYYMNDKAFYELINNTRNCGETFIHRLLYVKKV